LHQPIAKNKILGTMTDFKIHEALYEDWETEHDADYVRSDSHGKKLTKMAIETPENLQFSAIHAGNIIVGNLVHMHYVYWEHLDAILNGDPLMIKKYIIPLKPNRVNGHERYWLNNRSYLKERGREEDPFPMINVAQVEICPIESS
jgi:hypothetical protein